MIRHSTRLTQLWTICTSVFDSPVSSWLLGAFCFPPAFALPQEKIPCNELGITCGRLRIFANPFPLKTIENSKGSCCLLIIRVSTKIFSLRSGRNSHRIQPYPRELVIQPGKPLKTHTKCTAKCSEPKP